MIKTTTSRSISNTDISPASDYEMRVLRAIRRIFRAVDIHSKTLQNAKQITTPQLVMLIAIVRKGPMSLTMLNQSFDLGARTAAGIVSQLESKGLVSKVHGTHDRWHEVIVATAAGELLAREAPLPLQSRFLDGFRVLPEEEQSIIALELEKLVSLIGAADIDASAILDQAPIATPAHAHHHKR